MIKIKRRCRRGFVLISMGHMTHISYETEQIKRRICFKLSKIKDKKKWAYRAYKTRTEYRENPTLFNRMLIGGFMGIDDD